MDKLKKQREIVSKVLKNVAAKGSSLGRIDEYAVCDESTDNYLLLNVGWHPNGRRQNGTPIHIRLINGKVSIEWDGTDQEIAQQLIENGVDENDIVLGFEQPEKLAA